ncbi:MAG TPA: hypothetical protein VFP44_13800, partial [Usitatibacter sp.]|nr:hypothetical protein [Usitatibacter sp.]
AGVAASGVPPMPPPAQEPPRTSTAQETARTTTARTLAAVGTAERAWRKGLSFTFVVLVVVAAVLAGLGIIGVATGMLPIEAQGVNLFGATGTVAGMVGIVVAFVVVVLAIAIVLAVVYGLGFLFVGLGIFIPLVVVVALFPVLAPLLLVGLFIWWLVRRHDRKLDAARPPAK